MINPNNGLERPLSKGGRRTLFAAGGFSNQEISILTPPSALMGIPFKSITGRRLLPLLVRRSKLLRIITQFFSGIALTLFAANAHAMFCPTNFNIINYGDTLEQVQQQCGKPESQTTKKASENQPQEWTYYEQPDHRNPTATIKMSVAFNQGKVVNISLNGTSLISTPICGHTIKTGDSADSVKAICGKPAYINESPKDPEQKPTEVTELLYGGTAPVTLVFESGKFTAKK